MSIGTFSYPIPVNEPVLSYAPGSTERAALKKTVAELKSQQVDVPMYIGSEEVRSGKLVAMSPPHEKAHVLGHYHADRQSYVQSRNPCRLFLQQYADSFCNWQCSLLSFSTYD